MKPVNVTLVKFKQSRMKCKFVWQVLSKSLWLASTRKRHKITQATVGTRVGLSQNRISYLESHPDEISVKQLLSWCSALELELQLGERDTSAAINSAEW